MQVKIIPGKVRGVVTVPPSKSLTHRALVCATLAHGESALTNNLKADDTEATMEACRSFGASIKQEEFALSVRGTGGALCIPSKPLVCGLSGATLRFALALAALAPGKTILTGGARLLERPLQPLYDALTVLGAEVLFGPRTITVRGGALKSGLVKLPGNISSQFVSALLMIAPFLSQGMTIEVEEPIYSRPYIDLTIDLMRQFGVEANAKGGRFSVEPGQKYRAWKYAIEGDYSSAQYWFAAAVMTGGEARVEDLRADSKQGDMKLLDILQGMGGEVKMDDGAIIVRGGKQLRSFSVDGRDIPDLVPTLAVLAAVAQGTSSITRIGHLRGKESDRLAAPVKELEKMGVRVEIVNDSLRINGGRLKGAVIDPHGDHRMAMAFAVAGLAAEGETVIQDAEVVSKSYPGFWEALGAITRDDTIFLLRNSRARGTVPPSPHSL